MVSSELLPLEIESAVGIAAPGNRVENELSVLRCQFPLYIVIVGSETDSNIESIFSSEYVRIFKMIFNPSLEYVHILLVYENFQFLICVRNDSHPKNDWTACSKLRLDMRLIFINLRLKAISELVQSSKTLNQIHSFFRASIFEIDYHSIITLILTIVHLLQVF